MLIVGHKKEKLIDYVKNKYSVLDSFRSAAITIDFAEQNEQLGTGHAVMQAEPLLKGFSGYTLILAGDVPLLQADTLRKFIKLSQNDSSDLSVLSTIAENPFAYGRILRDSNNKFIKIVEEKDADDSEKLIKEINSGIFYVKTDFLFSALKKIKSDNAQKEFYLTDIIEILSKENHIVTRI